MRIGSLELELVLILIFLGLQIYFFIDYFTTFQRVPEEISSLATTSEPAMDAPTIVPSP